MYAQVLGAAPDVPCADEPYAEEALSFPCAGEQLVGVLAGCARPAAQRCVLIIVGGPQYRAGSHRQFVLLARHLAAHGIPSLRFDYRGMGDSEGAMRSFEQVQDDVRAAVDVLLQRSGAREVVLWGLCDAASAALFYAPTDPRVSGVVLLNPWVRTEEGIARAQLKHYYGQRLLDGAFWRRVARGEFDFVRAARGLTGALGKVLRGSSAPSAAAAGDGGGSTGCGRAPLPDRMADCLARFAGRSLFILSGDDLTAQEFRDTVRASRRWRNLVGGARVSWRDLPEANHTFSRRQWRDQVSDWTLAWLRSW